VCQSARVTASDLGLAPSAGGARRTSQSGIEPTPFAFSAPAAVAPPSAHDPERMEIERVLVESGGVIATAAALLGISRQALYRRMDRLGIELERRPKA
jgi:transcriptional regulator with GAF, ATPase, and Fis domain